MSVRVVAVEDDSRCRASLEVLFRHAEDFILVTAYPPPDAVFTELDASLARGAKPEWELVLTDLELPGLSGVECTRRVKQQLPETAVVVLTVFEDCQNIFRAICAGADGYLLKRTLPDRLLTQLRAVLAAGSPLSVSVARTVLDRPSRLHDQPGDCAPRRVRRANGTCTRRRVFSASCQPTSPSAEKTSSDLLWLL